MGASQLRNFSPPPPDGADVVVFVTSLNGWSSVGAVLAGACSAGDAGFCSSGPPRLTGEMGDQSDSSALSPWRDSRLLLPDTDDVDTKPEVDDSEPEVDDVPLPVVAAAAADDAPSVKQT